MASKPNTTGPKPTCTGRPNISFRPPHATAGPSKPKHSNSKCRATQTTPNPSVLMPGEPCAIDFEFQKYKRTDIPGARQQHRIGRVSIVNTHGDVALDVFAIYPNEPNVEKCWQPAKFGVKGSDLRFDNGGVDARKVERWCKELMQGRDGDHAWWRA
jgi:hypothetical protein